MKQFWMKARIPSSNNTLLQLENCPKERSKSHAIYNFVTTWLLAVVLTGTYYTKGCDEP